MPTVRAPNRSHNGISAGVRFTAGIGETNNPAALAYFRKAGYEITWPAAPVATSAGLTVEIVPDAYEGLTKRQLLALAVERGVEIGLPATNAAIREALIAAALAEEAAAGSVVGVSVEADPFAPGGVG